MVFVFGTDEFTAAALAALAGFGRSFATRSTASVRGAVGRAAGFGGWLATTGAGALSWAGALAWLVAGTPVTWLYDPPWTLPFFRRNEVAVPVKPR